MSRRIGLPGASELFRPTSQPSVPDAGRPAPVVPPQPAEVAAETPQATGRVRHDEKITVYVSSDELLALEQFRLDLRAQHRLGVDRGRIVRAAIAAALADVRERGAEADVVKRLME